MVSGRSVLVLDASMRPLSVISRRRMAVLLSKQRITFLSQEMEQEVLSCFAARRLARGPVIVRLTRSIQVPRRLLSATRSNLLVRDAATCQYCGAQPPLRELTIDHVTPLSRGGSRRAWENQVIACSRCNHRKADRSPEEVGLHLRRPPRRLYDEWATVLLLRYPALQVEYQRLLTA
jgi:5-methylcytosine-specific restriction endonuclease McrA